MTKHGDMQELTCAASIISAGATIIFAGKSNCRGSRQNCALTVSERKGNLQIIRKAEETHGGSARVLHKSDRYGLPLNEILLAAFSTPP